MSDRAAVAPQGSVFLTGQVCSRDQRRGRYTKESLAHPGKMLPSIARYLIRTFTEPDEWVCDPMAGIATTIVEAMHRGRHGVGVEYEARWAALADRNIDLAASQGATGTGEIYHGDSRRLPALIPPELHGRIALVITSPPYGPSTHGHARTPGPRRGKVRRINHRYGTDAGNLAYRDHDELAGGLTQILTGVAAILRPGGIVAITARPYRRHGALVDIPGLVVAAGTNAGLRLHDECAALIAGIRDGRLISRASFFQQKNIRAAIARGDPQWLVQHEDVILLRANSSAGPSLDLLNQRCVDRCPPLADRPGDATRSRSGPDQEPERTIDPCLPFPRPVPDAVRPAAGHVRPTDHDPSRPPADSPDLVGRR